jgi:hypothetical protein
MDGNRFEYANLKFVRGSHGGLYLTFYLPFDVPQEIKLELNGASSDNTGLGQALAQLGMNGWEVVSKASHDVFLLMREMEEDRPIDRPVLLGFSLQPVAQPEVVQPPEQDDGEKEYTARVQAARMGISIGDSE